MQYVKELDALYVHLKDVLMLPNNLTDLLRAEWVYTISAMDKLIHDLIRIGMIEAFQGSRVKTKKFLSFGITVHTHTNISTTIPGSIPPAEYWFEQDIIQKNKFLSFQEPEKIAEGLSLIWEEQHKWQKLATVMGIDQSNLTTRLKTIITRRNQIVHEADLDILAGTRNNITKIDTDGVVAFVEQLSEQIFNIVK